MSKLILTTVLTLGLAAATSQAATFNVDNASGTFDGQTTVALPAVGGIIPELTAFGGLGTFNSNADGLGINNVSGSDDRVDVGEAIVITFNQEVAVTEIILGDAFTGSESARITIGANGPVILAGTGAADDVYAFTTDNIGMQVAIEGNVGDFGLISFTVTPEPASMALLGLGTLCVLRRRK